MSQITLKIDGMHCPMCEAHVADAIRRALPAAKKVKANHRKGEATFVVEEGLDYSSATKALVDGGYRVLDRQEGPEKKGFLFFKK